MVRKEGYKDVVVSRSVTFSASQFSKYIEALQRCDPGLAERSSCKQLMEDAIERFLREAGGDKPLCCELYIARIGGLQEALKEANDRASYWEKLYSTHTQVAH